MYEARIVNNGGADLKYHATFKGAGIDMGTGAASSIDVLMASLCGCVGHHVHDYLVDRKVAYQTLTVKAETGLTADRMLLAYVHLAIGVDGAPVGSDILSQAETCPIFNTLRKGVEISVRAL